MAGNGFTVSTPQAGVALASGSIVSALQLTSGSNQDVKIVGITWSFHGVSTTDPSVEVMLNYCSAGGTTPGGSVTPVNVGGRAVTTRTTASYGPWSAEPTVASQAYLTGSQPELSGVIYFPFGQEIYFGPSAPETIITFAFKVVSGAANTVYATVHCEE